MTSFVGETVRMTTLQDVMSRALTSLPDREIVLKLNVEGAVGDILLPLAPSELAPVVEVHLDYDQVAVRADRRPRTPLQGGSRRGRW